MQPIIMRFTRVGACRRDACPKGRGCGAMRLGRLAPSGPTTGHPVRRSEKSRGERGSRPIGTRRMRVRCSETVSTGAGAAVLTAAPKGALP
jgi:hypothetical protein